jgi:DNA-binding HxlR family transcriptional regulator
MARGRFTEIRDAMGISPRSVAQTLRAFERDDLVVRRRLCREVTAIRWQCGREHAI